MPKKTPEPEQAPKADNYAKINMPAAFLTTTFRQVTGAPLRSASFPSPRGRR